jgi:hypothetical protein
VNLGDLGVRLRHQKAKEIIDRLAFIFRTDVQFVQMPAKQAKGRPSLNANQMSPPAALLNSLNDVNGRSARGNWKDAWKRRHVTRAVVHRVGILPYGLLAFRDAVEIAHSHLPRGPPLSSKS